MDKEKYEISLWEDELVTENNISYYKERKIAIIGSDTMTATCRAFEPQLVENINGTVKFTFKMFYTCKNDTYEDLVKQFCVQPNGETFYGSEQVLFLLRGLEFVHNSYKNPFLSLLINERKVKVFWKNKWYDLIIKNCQEDSDKKTITYTCDDIYINELSKTGFNIELDNELENNTGTITELAQTILQDADWVVDKDNSDLIQQTKEEALYEVKTTSEFVANNETEYVYTEIGSQSRVDPNEKYYYLVNGKYVLFTGSQFDPRETYYTRSYAPITIPNNSTILVYYSPVQNLIKNIEAESGISYLQFAYTNEPYDLSEGGQLITNVICCSEENVFWEKGNFTTVDGNKIAQSITFTSRAAAFSFTIDLTRDLSKYRAERLICTVRTIFDPLVNKYCEIYRCVEDYGTLSSQGDIIYKYNEIRYRDPTTVNNLIVNNKNFTSVAGWSGDNLTFQLYPALSTDSSALTPRSYLKFTKDQEIYNSGLRQLSNYIPDGFSLGEQYIFRYKIRDNDATDPSHSTPASNYLTSSSYVIPLIANSTTLSDGSIVSISSESYFSLGSAYTSDDWIEYPMTCTSAISRADIYNNKTGIFFTVSSIQDVWLEQAEFFPLVYGETIDSATQSSLASNDSASRINPGNMNILSVAAFYYSYYNHTKNSNIISLDELTYLWNNIRDITESDILYSKIKPIYNDDFEKIRTFNAKQSNRYNLLQKLGETFECWVQFNIEHNSDGSIVYENGVPKKSVCFKKENGQKTGIGFIYGIDLKTIQRTIKSDQIVTKTIVTPNKNQFAENGLCTIARSKENPSRNNFILNFDYYISQNLIDKDIVEAHINRYYTLLSFTTNYYNKFVNEESSVRTILLKQNSYLTLYDSAISAANEQINELKNAVIRILDVEDWDAVIDFINNPEYQHTDEVDSRINAICNLQHTIEEYTTSYNELSESVEALRVRLNTALENQAIALQGLKSIHLWFNKLYARFIQEGTWIDENYTDDDLYYLDALKNSRKSSRPQVSYTISVLRLSSLDEFKAKVFHLGDISYIQDTEFFGYVMVDGIKTPYKEIVLLSEITSNFDEPEKDLFKIQNYKTEFEDLFQRINNTSQSFHYSAGGYDRINNTINSNGTIKEKVLQDSINAGNFSRVTSNEQVIQTPTEFVVSDVVNTNRKTKITAGGVFTTEDGGLSWKNTVNATGLQPQALAPGSINIEKVNIVDAGNNIVWNNKGLIMRGTDGDEGISVNDNKAQGKFNYFSIYDKTTTRALDATDELQFTNNEIQHYSCDGNNCDFEGRIAFGSSGISIFPKRNSTTRLELKNKEILLQVDNGNVIFSDINPDNLQANHLTFNLNEGKMIYTWYDSTSSSQMDTVVNLKTFTT